MSALVYTASLPPSPSPSWVLWLPSLFGIASLLRDTNPMLYCPNHPWLRATWVTGSYWRLVRSTGDYIAQKKNNWKLSTKHPKNSSAIPDARNLLLAILLKLWPRALWQGPLRSSENPLSPLLSKLIAMWPGQLLNSSCSVIGSTLMLCCVLTLPPVYTLRGFVFTILEGPARSFPKKSLVLLDRQNRQAPWGIRFQKHLISSSPF